MTNQEILQELELLKQKGENLLKIAETRNWTPEELREWQRVNFGLLRLALEKVLNSPCLK